MRNVPSGVRRLSPTRKAETGVQPRALAKKRWPLVLEITPSANVMSTSCRVSCRMVSVTGPEQTADRSADPWHGPGP